MVSENGVYVKDKDFGWLPANVISMGDNGTTAYVSVSVPEGDGYGSMTSKEKRTVQLNEYEDNALPLQNVDERGNPIEMPDMCDLPSLHEAAILYNLKIRHQRKQPYTRAGDIVIAMNPFEWIDRLYSKKTKGVYVEKLINNVNVTGDAKSGLEPHVYEASALAYKGLARDGCHQSILVSGESGAGKTETVKIVMSHLASIQSGEEGRLQDSAEIHSNNIVRRVIDSNPLLEAFGNAKTCRNDNSSRFGKYILLQFDVEDQRAAAVSGRVVPSCILAGSTCETYLLEKSRVVSHEMNERTYHIFYQLLAAPESTKADIWDGIVQKKNSSFRYIGETETTTIEGLTDAEKYEKTVAALSLVGVVGNKLKTLMRAICTVLQLGNLTFSVDPENDDGSIISSEDELQKLSELMGIQIEEIEKALTFRTVVAGKDTYSVPMQIANAQDGCNAFAKEIYSQIFDWLVRIINCATSAESNYKDNVDVDHYGNIGLLDIFGFESLAINRFEQLCINYANEKLQALYNADIFRSVQEEYEYEGIKMTDSSFTEGIGMTNTSFTNNAIVLNLIEGKIGIISALNEECIRPKGNDLSFVSKLKAMNKEVTCFIQNPLHLPTEFEINHYAASIKYDALQFVQKNTDNLPNDLVQCACKSSNDLISRELKLAAEKKLLQSTGRGTVIALTVASKFQMQLSSLMSNISKTKTRYIRCIKPNTGKIPFEINLSSSVEQLRCAGVVAAITISRAAYPNRLTHTTALERFCCLSLNKSNSEDEEKKDDLGYKDSLMERNVTFVISYSLQKFKAANSYERSMHPFAVGKSRVYFRAGALEYLENQRMNKFVIFATLIEKSVRRFIARSRFLRLKSASIFLQSLARRNVFRENLLLNIKAVTILSCWIRIIFAKRELFKLRRQRACILIQTRTRITLDQRFLQQSKAASIYIQKNFRRSIQKRKYVTLQDEAREEAQLNKKLAALQRRLIDAEMMAIKADKARLKAENHASAGNGREKMVELQSQPIRLLDESTKMLTFLKKQVLDLRSKKLMLEGSLTDTKNENCNLSEQCSSISASYEVLRQHTVRLSQANTKLSLDQDTLKKELNKLHSFMKVKEENDGQFIAKQRQYIVNLELEIEKLSKNSRVDIQTTNIAKGLKRRSNLKKKKSFFKVLSPRSSMKEKWKLSSKSIGLPTSTSTLEKSSFFSSSPVRNNSVITASISSVAENDIGENDVYERCEI